MIFTTLLVISFAICLQNTRTLIPADKTFNAACTLNVGDNSDYKTVTDALKQTCSEYIIHMVDSNHTEHLELNINELINITHSENVSTRWTINEVQDEIIVVKQGNVSLVNLEFHYTVIVINQTNQTVVSPRALVSVGDDPLYNPSVTLLHCHFHSVINHTDGASIEVEVHKAGHIKFLHCWFRGQGLLERSNVSYLKVGNASHILVERCIFHNSSIHSPQGAVQLFGEISNCTIHVLENQFEDIFSHNTHEHGILAIVCISKSNVVVWANTFQTLYTFNSIAGALFLVDSSLDSSTNDIVVEKNTFRNNFGVESGGIFLHSHVQNSRILFIDNMFHYNKGMSPHGHHQDVQLGIRNPSGVWKESNIIKEAKKLFKGCETDQFNSSVGIWVNLTAYGDQGVTKELSLKVYKSGGSQFYKYFIGFLIGAILAAAGFIIVFIVMKFMKKVCLYG
ncbi:MAG: hypothetical protein EZS28_006990 [Streblomastix strix]|uniref:Right handed beta helix domain-containing protein n=1 Tax=Streblomastix strix TaxID=222440 RepID=A0A5J4WSD0_9EUKA|nr:MAG: hypothetical protein EZS28_006990 [Streblomastix strix]